jgi:hypothetical protein
MDYYVIATKIAPGYFDTNGVETKLAVKITT